MKRTHRCGELRRAEIGQDVALCGWIHRRRDHGGLIFVDLRDVSGLLQIVFSPEKKELFATVKELRPEFVISVQGKVRERPQGTGNPNLPTGEVEVVGEAVTVLNPSQTPPFEVEDKTSVSEEMRLAYRYIDLRRKNMQKNLILRHRVSQIVRNFLDRERFIEVETPILTKSTPEGARDFLVPSRLDLGKFYALPQSPQLFKQLLMVAGFDRYFQISRCFRDEDLRADRQPEFTQIDMELSFPGEEEIFDLVKRLLLEIFGRAEELIGRKLEISFEAINYPQALDRFGADSPDTRFGVELSDLTDLLKECGFQAFDSIVKRGGRILGLNAPEGAQLSGKRLEKLRETVKEMGKKMGEEKPDLASFTYENGTLVSPFSKYFQKEALIRIKERLGVGKNDLAIIVAGEKKFSQRALGRVRDALKEKEYLEDPLLKGKEKVCRFVWVTEFPLFEEDEEKHIASSHHPFTAPQKEDVEHFLRYTPQEKEELLKIRSRAYDIVLNGIELGSGSIRIHERNVQKKVFEILNLSKEEQEERFGFLLNAFEYGAPPHGGIAFGLDRLVAMLVDLRDEKFSDTEKATSIREVIAFPKTQKGSCPLTVAPSDISKEKLKELGLHIRKESSNVL